MDRPDWPCNILRKFIYLYLLWLTANWPEIHSGLTWITPNCPWITLDWPLESLREKSERLPSSRLPMKLSTKAFLSFLPSNHWCLLLPGEGGLSFLYLYKTASENVSTEQHMIIIWYFNFIICPTWLNSELKTYSNSIFPKKDLNGNNLESTKGL